MLIPQLVLRQLYTRGSLHNTPSGFAFSIKNRLTDVILTEICEIMLDGTSLSLKDVHITSSTTVLKPRDISKKTPLAFKLRDELQINLEHTPLGASRHTLGLCFKVEGYGKLHFSVDDSIVDQTVDEVKIPRDKDADYSPVAVKDRQQFAEHFTGIKLEHVTRYSFDSEIAKGNIENLIGVVQVPLGIAGPIDINGEYANGSFLVPLATTEGTLVASYNRGIKLLNKCGGAKVTVVEDAMQRAPVFVFEDARNSRTFVQWVKDNFDKIKEEADATSSVANLKYIDPYLSNKFAYLRFNYLTGDAAGQNMVGRATFAACSWIIDHYKGGVIRNFYLESNLATDKKGSQINVMHSRGKRVIAEATLSRDLLEQYMRVTPDQLNYHANVSNVGAFLSAANNNGAHSPNAIAAMFIATGQDAANVAESSAGILYTELTADGDLYISLTIPSLIVATYGGGTGLPTQRECLELMGCYGKGRVYKLAEIIGGVALAGEISLGSAISSSDWVSSHETYGRNR